MPTKTQIFRSTALTICSLGAFAFAPAYADDDLARYKGKTITIEEASKIAVDHIGGTVIEVDFDDQDTANNNKAVFEVEIMKDGVEHEVKVDAESGAIVKTEIDD
jgi:uncharacterized membrane protein YkoI